MLLGGPTILEAVSLIDTHRKAWTTKDNTYEGIMWGDDESIPRPTKEQVEAKLKELMDAYDPPLIFLRRERNLKLQSTDFLMVSDFPYPSEDIREAWKTYRQKLRNITATVTPSLGEDGDLVVTWPTPPIWPANVV
jgi:hypothetical protein